MFKYFYFRAGYIDLKLALEFTSYLNKEKDYIPWSSALKNLGYIGSMFSMKPAYSDYEVRINDNYSTADN